MKDRLTEPNYIYHDCDYMDSGMAPYMNRLAAYEDTGLEPEEIKTLYKTISELAGELAKYKEAEEQGRLIVLPCKVGDCVFTVQRNVVSEMRITGYEYGGGLLFAKWELVDGLYGIFRVYGIPAGVIGNGKTVFLTREEAEAALEVQGQ